MKNNNSKKLLIFNTEYNTGEERKNYLEYLIKEQEKDKTFTNKELQDMADYLLYGKDEDGLSPVDEGIIYIDRGIKKKRNRVALSLDYLLENPLFDENNIVTETKYKVVKTEIDREKDKDIPYMKELWENIDRLRYQYAVSTGKIKDENIKILTGKQLQRLNFLIIELSREQYLLKDIDRPPLMPKRKRSYVDDKEFDILVKPLGRLNENPKLFYEPYNSTIERENFYLEENVKDANYVIDLTDSEQVYLILEKYLDLKEESQKQISSLEMSLMLETLEFYIIHSFLAPSRKYIFLNKIAGVSNEEIKNGLQEIFNISYNINYISTIWKGEICAKIADTAQQHLIAWENRFKEDKWKICKTCGRKIIINDYNFVKNKRTGDGYSNRCKLCDRQQRGLEDNIYDTEWLSEFLSETYGLK